MEAGEVVDKEEYIKRATELVDSIIKRCLELHKDLVRLAWFRVFRREIKELGEVFLLPRVPREKAIELHSLLRDFHLEVIFHLLLFLKEFTSKLERAGGISFYGESKQAG